MASILARDDDGNQIVRTMIAEGSSTYKAKLFSFMSSKAGSIYSKDRTGLDLGETHIHFYSSSAEIIFQEAGYETETEQEYQTRITANCVKTICCYDSKTTYWLRGADFQLKVIPTESVFLYATMAQHIPAQYGGDVRFMDGGYDLSYLTEQHNVINCDGGAAVKVICDEVNCSHRLSVQLDHPVGFQLSLQVKVRQYT